MEEEVSILFLAKTFPGIPESKLKSMVHSDFHRKHLGEQRERKIDDIWIKRTGTNPHLFDGSKFRFGSIASSNNGETVLSVGITGYKDFLGTNWASDAKSLLQKGLDDFRDSQAYMSDPLGVGSFVMTSDNFVIFLRRSQQVGEAQGLWDIPGGHPEPGEIPGGHKSAKEVNLSNLSPEDVTKEFYLSTLREVSDEVNVPLSTLTAPTLMGVAINHTSSGRPSAEFFVKCSLDADEVLRRYKQGGAEADESSTICFVPLSEIPPIETSAMWKEMAPSAKGCMKLYNALHSEAVSS